MVAAHPVQGAFHLAVGFGHAALGMRVVFGIYLDDISVFVFLASGTFHDVRVLQAHFLSRRHAEVFLQYYAISACPSEDLERPTVVGAQAANELLNVVGIKASFVMTEYNDMIYVSARAIDEVNVQIIMERIGGGGHINTAGAQFAHTDMKKAIDILKETINVMIEEGDI